MSTAPDPDRRAESVAGIRTIFGKEMRGGLEAGHQHMSWSSTPVPRCPACVEWAKESLAQIKNPRDLLTDEQNAKLNEDLAEMSRLRRRAEAASRGIPLC